jgi:hypothetical protein
MSGIMSMLLGARTAIAVAVDEFFNRVTLLLPGDGTNGAQNNTFLDSSTNNFTITRNGNTTQDTFSPFSQTGWSNFFASGSYIFTASNSAIVLSTGSWTIEAWAFCTGGSGYRSVLSKRTGGTAEYEMGIDPSGFFYFYTGTSVYATTTTVPLNTWTNLTITYDGTNLRMFQDGVLTLTQAGVTAGSGTGNLAISIEAGTATQAFPGYISNVRITKGGALYTNTFTPSTTPLTTTVSSGTVSFLTCQSNRFVDASASPLSISIVGSPSVQPFSPFLPTIPYSAATVGGSGYFDGSGDYLGCGSQTAYAFGTGVFTVEAWVYVTSRAAEYNIASTRGSSPSANGWSLSVVTSGGVTVYTDNYVFNAVGTVPLNAWTHIAFVRSGTGTNQTALYINGTSIATATNSQNFSNTTLAVGASNDGSQFPFLGYIGDIRFLKGTAQYTAAFTPPTAPLTNITNTSLLLNFTNAGITDATAKNDLETVGNAQISTTQSKFGGSSMYFDGTGDWLLLPASPNMAMGTGDFTWECWIYATAASDQPIYECRSTTSNTDGFTVTAFSSTVIRVYTNNVLVTATISNYLNTWTHVAFTRAGSTNRLFINGTLQNTNTASDNFSNQVAVVGGGRYSSNNIDKSFTGYIDDLRVTKGYARYTATFTPPTSAFPLQ